MKRLFATYAIVLVVIGFIGLNGREFIDNIFTRLHMDSFPAVSSSTRLLVAAPHSDDETLGSADLISKVLKAGGSVKVVLMTNGDGHTSAVALNYLTIRPSAKQYIDSAYTRQKETLEAMKIAGVNEKDIIFLGYPDGGMYHLWGENWDTDNLYTSRFTHYNHAQYKNSYTSRAPYCGISVVKDLEKIIGEYKPTDISFPHPEDHHPDHYATYCFIKYVISKLNLNVNQYLYLVHRGDWPTPFGKFDKLFLVPPKLLVNTGTSWISLSMSRQEEMVKGEMIRTYKSQMEVMSIFLEAFIRKNELYGNYPDTVLFAGKGGSLFNVNDTIITGPAFKRIRHEVSRAAYLKAVRLNSDSESMQIYVETEEPPQKNIRYHIDMILFTLAGETYRVNMAVDGNSTVSLFSDTSENIMSIQGIQLIPEKKSIHVKIPFKSLPSFDSLFISASSSVNSNGIDRTAWRLVKKS